MYCSLVKPPVTSNLNLHAKSRRNVGISSTLVPAHRFVYRDGYQPTFKPSRAQQMDVKAQAGTASGTAGMMAPEPTPAVNIGDAARKALVRATRAVSRYGWTSFWIQLSLSVISAVILLFSVAFTSPVSSGPKASLYLTLVGVLCGFLSTFWNFGYTRLAIKMQAFIDAPPGIEVPKIKKQQVLDMVTKGLLINMLGLGATLLGVQTLVGMLVAKTLSNASVNPFLASASGAYNPVLALDVFLVQAAINTLLGHFLSLCSSLWLLNVVGEGKGLKFQATSIVAVLDEVDVAATTSKDRNLPPPRPPAQEFDRPTFSPPVTAAARTILRAIVDTSEIVTDRVRTRPYTLLPSKQSLSYLDGTTPGDFGFDPLGLYRPGSNASVDQRWIQSSEVLHGRWAMLGAAGCLAPEVLARKGAIPKELGMPWFDTFGHHYWLDGSKLAMVGVAAMAVAEAARWADYRKPRSVAAMQLQGAEVIFNDTTGDPLYPGGKVFNFLNPLDGGDLLLDMKEREVKHGRLAMLACLGFAVQAAVTHEGPYKNLLEHFENPGVNNFVGYLTGEARLHGAEEALEGELGA